ncbi:MAG: hypothetical protein U0R18_19015 [Mycobacterium sp.]
MTDARKRRKAKQARRDARRSKQRDESPEETPLVGEVRDAIDSGDPMELLGLAAMVIEVAYRDDRDDDERPALDGLVESFIGVPIPETTALLAVLAEILIYEDTLRGQCRREVAARGDDLPAWLTGLSDLTIERVVRMTHVLGDGDELLIGSRLSDGQPLTCAVFVDHNYYSFITDAFFVPTTVDELVDLASRSNDDPDTTFVEMSLADARTWIEHGIDFDDHFHIEDTDTWPACRPLVLWLASLMPEGGAEYEPAQSSWPETQALLDKFFASLMGQPFADPDHRTLLSACIDENNGDAMRWSEARLHMNLDWPFGFTEYHGSTQAALAVPDLLRAYIPFAHAQSGIRDQLTAEALAAIDAAEPGYRESVLADQDD